MSNQEGGKPKAFDVAARDVYYWKQIEKIASERGWKVSRAKNAFVFAEIRPQHFVG